MNPITESKHKSKISLSQAYKKISIQFTNPALPFYSIDFQSYRGQNSTSAAFLTIMVRSHLQLGFMTDLLKDYLNDPLVDQVYEGGEATRIVFYFQADKKLQVKQSVFGACKAF